MFEKLREWVRRWLGIKLPQESVPVEEFTRRYEDIRAENITAVIAGKLSTLTIADSSMTVEGEGARADFIRDILEKLWSRDCAWITAQMLGKGGKVLIPSVTGGALHVDAIDQSRLRIVEMRGDRITSALLMVDSGYWDEKRYDLIASYSLEEEVGNPSDSQVGQGPTATGVPRSNPQDSTVAVRNADFETLQGFKPCQSNGLRRRAGGSQAIRYKIVNDSGAEVALDALPLWPGLVPEITIANTDRLLFAYLRCPRDNRRDVKRYGVPITYGAERLLEELAEHANTYRREFKLTRPMLGLDSTLWARGFDGGTAKIDTLRKTVQDGDDPFIPLDSPVSGGSAPWQYYAPSIRQDAMEQRYQSLCRRVEKACGLSQGILTERQTLNYANRDEVRAAQYDTFSVVRGIRDAWEAAFDDLAYAIDVLAERFGLTPAGGRGQATVTFDWDQSLIESTTETFAQMSELESRGMVSSAELRQWVIGGSLEDAQAAVEEIKGESTQNSPLQQALSAPEGLEE